MIKYFYSCDWGTTKLRVRLVDMSAGVVISAIETEQGIAKVFSAWRISDTDRETHYKISLQNCITKLKNSLQPAVEDIPVIVSGMATSNIGMIELPYAQLPVNIDGTGLLTQTIQSSRDFAHPLILVSGVRTKTDIMRGEEVQVIGAYHTLSGNDGLFIVPGTHSKHVWTRDKIITDLKTYMTGELFQLLTTHSILSGSLASNDDYNMSGWESFFEEGIMRSLETGLLENLFGLRVAHLFNQRTPQQNNYFLNGLLIGSELKNLLRDQQQDIVLVSNELQKKYYTTAVEMLKVRANISWISSEAATVNGHSVILKRRIM